MPGRRLDPLIPLIAIGLMAFLLAGLSIVDMYSPRPYDGVVLEADALGELRVRDVVSGSGADRAGIQHGDQILGISREMLRSTSDAAERLNRHPIGAVVPYLIRGAHGVKELEVELGPRRFGSLSYLYACVLGFAFFFVGVFVLLRQPRMRTAQVFFLLCALFMLFLICRLRPASYSRIDTFVLSTGTAALLFLPATFLHFFLIFPYPIWKRLKALRFPLAVTQVRVVLMAVAMYAIPPLVLLGTLMVSRRAEHPLPLISGAPAANWWVLALYMVLGLGALALNAGGLKDPRERRGAAMVLFGSLFGLVPFLVLAVAFPALLHTEQFLYLGVFPLFLVPLTFAYAIVRFQLLDIRIILRKSLLYTLTTAAVTGLYALAIASFNWIFRGTQLAESSFSPILLALAIVVLFEPLRKRIQVPVDRFFFAERSRLQKAMVEMGEAFNDQTDLGAVVRNLVERLPGLLGLRFAALYLEGGGKLRRVAGPSRLPAELPIVPALHSRLRRDGGLARVDLLGPLQLLSRPAADLLRDLGGTGVELVGGLASQRRTLGLAAVSGKAGQMSFEQVELELLRRLFQQASVGLETQRLLEERTRQAELERELEIAASIQADLLPSEVELAPGWSVSAVCRPARDVGGDFITKLPGPQAGTQALVYGDVSGKSVSGALVMMAANEILNTLAMTSPHPEELLKLANERLYHIAGKSFVALTYLAPTAAGSKLSYLLAGQPQPMKRRLDGTIVDLPFPDHRLPLGALNRGEYRMLEVDVAPGETVLGYSDGVVEARSSSGEFFGEERLAEVLERAAGEPHEIVERVLAAVETFTNGNEPYDDLTLVAVCRQAEVT